VLNAGALLADLMHSFIEGAPPLTNQKTARPAAAEGYCRTKKYQRNAITGKPISDHALIFLSTTLVSTVYLSPELTMGELNIYIPSTPPPRPPLSHPVESLRLLNLPLLSQLFGKYLFLRTKDMTCT